MPCRDPNIGQLLLLLLLPPSAPERGTRWSHGCALAHVMLTASAGKWSRNRCAEAHGPVRFDGWHIVQVNLDGDGERDRLRCLCHTHACRDKQAGTDPFMGLPLTSFERSTGTRPVRQNPGQCRGAQALIHARRPDSLDQMVSALRSLLVGDPYQSLRCCPSSAPLKGQTALVRHRS